MAIDEEEEEKSKGFKVDDRRRFSAEGDLKPEYRGAEPAAEIKSERGSGVGASPAQPAAPAADAGSGKRAAAAFSKYREQSAEITFETFLVGLSTQALMHLGEIPDPHSGQIGQDLTAAQQLIDIIGMLKEKTRGNVDHDEQALLDAILFELRMKYVERARHAPQ